MFCISSVLQSNLKSRRLTVSNTYHCWSPKTIVESLKQFSMLTL
jgi:hypothetical protein